MFRFLSAHSLLCSSFLLSACALTEKTEHLERDPAIAVVAMRCDSEQVIVVYQDPHAWLSGNGKSYALNRAISASGARYVSPIDERIELWNKGREATITTERGKLPLCQPEPASNGLFQARGNEPFWNLTIERGSVAWRQIDGNLQIEKLTNVELFNDDLKLLSKTLSILITPQTCQDSMSGLLYPNNVSAETQDRMWSGCGGALSSADSPPP